ncbi:hypothetical protein GCM10025771_24750 [Niveibacterium umoris]|nr:TIGR03016 family PEP-CTERM system-associated outer membrane protein [Niveibacterium umoris]
MASGPFRLEPSVGLGLTWSDNVRLTNDGLRVSDWSARVEPGVSLSGRSGATYGSLRASVSANAYAKEDSLNRTNLNLLGAGTFDIYEKKLLIDASASVSQERLSSLGAPVSGVAYDPNNTTELRLLSLSPYARWQWRNNVVGELRYRATWSDSSSGVLSNGLRQDVTFSVGNGAAPNPFGWLLSGSDAHNHYSGANDTNLSNARLYGIYAIDSTFKLRADVGYERNDFGSAYTQEQHIYGVGFDWTPSSVTHVAGMTEQRFFGTGYNYEASWRGPRSAINVTFSRDVTTSSSTLGGAQLIGLLLSFADSYSKTISDPSERLRRAAEVWIQRGLPAEIGASTTYVTESYYLEKRAQASFALIGVRDSAGLSVNYSKRHRLVDPNLLAPGDELGQFDNVEDIGATLVISHRLTPVSSLSATLGGGRSNGQGLSGSVSSTRRRDASLVASTSFSASTVGSLSYRHQASSGVSEYDENSIAATLGVRF